MSTVKKVTLKQPRPCSKCKVTILEGEIAVKDARSPNIGRVYYHTECPKKR